MKKARAIAKTDANHPLSLKQFVKWAYPGLALTPYQESLIELMESPESFKELKSKILNCPRARFNSEKMRQKLLRHEEA